MASALAGTFSQAPAWSAPRRLQLTVDLPATDTHPGSIPPRRPHWRTLHSSQGETRYPAAAVRARHLQATMSLCLESLLVSHYSRKRGSLTNSSCLAKSTYAPGSGSVPSASRETPSRLITRISPRMPSRPSSIRRTPLLSTGYPAPCLARPSSFMWSIPVKRRIAWRLSRSPSS